MNKQETEISKGLCTSSLLVILRTSEISKERLSYKIRIVFLDTSLKYDK